MRVPSFVNGLITALFFTMGLFSLVSGQPILSTTLFGMACLASNVRPAKTKLMRF